VKLLVLMPTRGMVAAELVSALINNSEGYELVVRMQNRQPVDVMLHTLEQHPSIDVLAALFGPRASERGATAFRDRDDRTSYLIPEVNFTRGDLVDVDVTGLHFIAHRVSLLRALGPNPFGDGSGLASDDAAFCGRIRHGNGRITVATGIPVFHVDERNGAAYTPGVAACVIAGDRIDTTQLADELPTETRTYGPAVDRATATQVIPSSSRDSSNDER
jgi:hypothetical protein